MKSLQEYINEHLNSECNNVSTADSNNHIESINIITEVPDGMYTAIWCAYILTAIINGKKYKWNTPIGIRGKSQETIVVKNGKAIIQ